jgi:hypothetical protein
LGYRDLIRGCGTKKQITNKTTKDKERPIAQKQKKEREREKKIQKADRRGRKKENETKGVIKRGLELEYVQG